MKKQLLTLASVLVLGAAGMAQSPTVLANFDFNSSTSLPQNAGTTATNITASINGTESDAAFSGTATGSNAFVQNTTAGNAMSMNGNTNTNTWTMTLGGSDLYKYASFKMYFQAQRSSTGATTITLSYSTDGSTYTNVSTTASPGNGSFAEATIDMSSITAINNASALYIKFSGSGSTNNSGTLRIDNLEIEGTQSASGTSGNNTFFNGNVGIGTNNPAYPLDVVGAARISGATTVNSLSSGNVTSSGNLSVSGTTNLTGAVTTGALTSGATTVSSLSSSGNISTSGVLTANSLSVTAGATFDSLGVGKNLSFNGGAARISFIPSDGTNPNIFDLGSKNTTPYKKSNCYTTMPNSYVASISDLIQIKGTYAQSLNSNNINLLSMGYDGANDFLEVEGHRADGTRPGLLVDYYCGDDIYLATGITGGGNNINGGGFVQTGANLEIGAPTRNNQIALNLLSYGTTAMNLANSGNTSIFKVLTNGEVVAPALPTGTFGTAYSTLMVDASGNVVKALAATNPFPAWVLGGNISGGAYFGTADASDLPIETNGTERMRIMATGNIVANSNTGMSKIVFGSAYTSSLNYGTSYIGLNTQRDPVSGNWTAYTDNANNGGSILFGDVQGTFHFSPLPDKNPASGNATWTDADVLSHLTMSILWNTTTNAGQVFIGPKKPTYSNHDGSALSVYGDITTTALYVTDPTAKWADYVFEKDYKLMPLNEVENFYKKNHHLPSVPTTKEVQENGNNIAETDAILLQKIEELTLYVVEQQKQIEALKKQVQTKK